MNEFCKERAGKKFNIVITIDLEVAYLSDANNNNVATTEAQCVMENICLRGRSNVRSDYPNLGK